MPRVLEGDEADEAESFMMEARDFAINSPCQRDKRGVIIVNDGSVLGGGFNSLPFGINCCAKYCGLVDNDKTCKKTAIHAEMVAIAHSVAENGFESLKGSRMYHARVDENRRIVESRDPRCIACAKHLPLYGIEEFILNQKNGLTVYSARELFDLSLKNTGGL